MDLLSIYYSKVVNLVILYAYDYWQEVSDPRSKGLFLMSEGPWKVFAIMSIYLAFVTKIGPKLMKNRKAFDLRHTMIVYNVMVVLINAFFFYKAVYYLDFGKKLFDFKFPDKTDPKFYSKYELDKMWLAYIYGWTKVIDLFDTIFFVLRKKYSQITGLHLYHHTIMPIFGWLVIKIAPTATCLGIFPLLNTLVHIIMYSYYALAALGPKLRPYLWWKKYLTQIQLGQFVIFGFYAIIFCFKQEGYPMGVWICIGFPQPFLFGYMFYNFYRKSYRKQEKSRNNNNNNNNNLCKSIKNDKIFKIVDTYSIDKQNCDKKIS